MLKEFTDGFLEIFETKIKPLQSEDGDDTLIPLWQVEQIAQESHLRGLMEGREEVHTFYEETLNLEERYRKYEGE